MNKFIDFFKNADKRQWYWLWEMGVSKRKANIYKLRSNDFLDLKRPVFFLSTGRTGTKWFAKLLKKAPNLSVFHAGVPDLAIQNKEIYNLLQNDEISKNLQDKFIKEIFLSAREEYLIYSYKTQKRFVETNNQLLFFAPVIAKLFPQSIFVHLYRHPGEFVRSGMRRGWYDDNDFTKFKLIKSNKTEIWNNFSKTEKISWLWTETNQFIEDFKLSIDSKRVFSFNFNELTIERLLKLNNFIGTNISEKYIQKQISKKANVQQVGEYHTYDKWREIEKEQLRRICGDLANKYGYTL